MVQGEVIFGLPEDEWFPSDPAQRWSQGKTENQFE